MASKPHIVIVLSDSGTLKMMERNILSPEGYRVTTARTCKEGERLLTSSQPDLMILGDDLNDEDHLEFAGRMITAQPTLSIILFTREAPTSLSVDVVRLGLVDWLTAPLHPDEVLHAVRRGLQRSSNWEKWLKRETRRQTGELEQRVSVLETLASVGQAVTAELNVDRVLMVVVEAAVTYTGAEEGSLLLLDDKSGELYMRAGRNFHDEFVQTFRLPVQDTLAGGVLDTGEPVFINDKTPRKILTSYLVYSLIYVPLKVHGRVIGVLGVDHRSSGHAFDERDLDFMSALGDYAAIAIENAQLYANTELERNKLETILTQIKDGVIVLDQQARILLVNQTVRKAFDLENKDVFGLPFDKVFDHQDLLKIVRGEIANPFLQEVSSEMGHVYNVQLTEIPEVGTVVTLHDITYLKELDRMKSDFVMAVSHDLRSPLTAILGYMELIDRLGDMNEKQAEFLRRVRASVHSITDLIDNLLDLGRIEVGIDESIEEMILSPIIDQAVEDIQDQINKKSQNLKLEVAENLPTVVGDPIQMRQMLDNLLGNAVKYTPGGGDITLVAKEEDSQFICEVSDSGIGISPEDQDRIFDRFYRASNTREDTQGTGLGLAIVKTVVDNHRGRIWVDSILGEGSRFTVVLPIISEKS
jgi:two-component system NtrC family sensor kinase